MMSSDFGLVANDLKNGLLSTLINLIDFNIFFLKENLKKNKHFIVDDIENLYPGLTFKLKEHLKKETNYSNGRIQKYN